MEAEQRAHLLQEGIRSELKSTAENLTRSVSALGTSGKEQLDSLQRVMSAQLKDLVERNERRLAQIQETVYEKLQTAIDKKLGESFKQVSERLERVHQGLGDMQKLAAGVGDLKKVLTNVKNRGTWGEVQLRAILEQMLTADQFEKDVETVPGSGKRVEYAIRLPGRDHGEHPVWLPLDSKFPQEDYARLVEAADQGDVQGVKDSVKALETAIRLAAKDIRDKYIQPPHTTDFAIMFLPTEGLYAEVLRIPGMMESLQQDFRVIPTGPTTFSALVNSLRVGFQTLAIEQRSSEVWIVLGAVKTEFAKFAAILDKVKKNLDSASSTLENTGIRTRAMERTLRKVQEVPGEEAARLLELPDDIPELELPETQDGHS